MRKIFTVLLSILMITTLGFTNVSADTTTWDEYVSSVALAHKDITSFEWDDNNHDVFNVTMRDFGTTCGDSSSSICYYLMTTTPKKSLPTSASDWNQITGAQFTVSTGKDIGTYTLYIGKLVDSTITNIASYETTASVTKRPKPKLIINRPTYTSSNYYIVGGDDDIVLPFSITCKSEKYDTDVNVNCSIAGDNISIDNNGLLTISGSLKSGLRSYNMTVISNDEHYEDTWNTIRFTIVKGTDFTVDFKSDIIAESKNKGIKYGTTAKALADNIGSIYTIQKDSSWHDQTCTVWSSDGGNTTELSIKVQELNDEGKYIDVAENTVLEPSTSGDKKYNLTITVKQNYTSGETSGFYKYTINYDNFYIADKSASSATVEANDNLQYNGEDQVLATVTSSVPDNATITYKVSQSKYSGTEKEAYESCKATEVSSPKAKLPGTYYVYYHVTADYYDDSYGMVKCAINKKKLTINSDTLKITYDGENHKEDFSNYIKNNLNGCASGESEGTCYFVDYKKDKNKYINSGKYPATITAGDNYEIDGEKIDVKLKINKAKIKVKKIGDVIYNGNSQEIIPVVKSGKTTLSTKDYKVTYSKDTTNVGTVTVTVEGKGNYKGTVTRTYNITPASLSITTNSASKTYDGKPLTASGSIKGIVNNEKITLTLTGSQTEVGSSKNTYTLEYKDGAKESNYTVKEEKIGTLTVASAKKDDDGGSSSKVVTCEEANGKGWTWSETKKACVYKVSNTSAK